MKKSSSSAHKAQRIEYLNLCDLKSIQSKSNFNGISFSRCDPHNSNSPLPISDCRESSWSDLSTTFNSPWSLRYPLITMMDLFSIFSALENCSVRSHPSCKRFELFISFRVVVNMANQDYINERRVCAYNERLLVRLPFCCRRG